MAQAGLSQTTLADKAGVSRATVNRLVAKRQEAEQQTIKRLGRAMAYPFPDFDVVFPEMDESSAKRDSAGPGSPQERRSAGPRTRSAVREESGKPYSESLTRSPKSGAPPPSDFDLLEEIVQRPHDFARRMETAAAELGTVAVLAFLDDAEAICRERGYPLPGFFASIRTRLRQGGEAADRKGA